MNKDELKAYDAMMDENNRLRAINKKRLDPSLVVTKCEMRGKEILKVDLLPRNQRTSERREALRTNYPGALKL
jgi:hypothetical protein|tara:strand:- start:13763 stop:13981 length:219 start_codon:yes stop_codon:yes gene_type:complete